MLLPVIELTCALLYILHLYLHNYIIHLQTVYRLAVSTLPEALSDSRYRNPLFEEILGVPTGETCPCGRWATNSPRGPNPLWSSHSHSWWDYHRRTLPCVSSANTSGWIEKDKSVETEGGADLAVYGWGCFPSRTTMWWLRSQVFSKLPRILDAFMYLGLDHFL